MTSHNVPVLGYLVSFNSSPVKHTPARLREAASTRDAQLLHDALPDVVTPVAALGRAVKAPGATPDGHRWVHAGRADGASHWIFCASDVDENRAVISGYSGAEVHADGTLNVDASVPAAVASALREAYDAARGLVESSKVNAVVARLVAKTWRGQYLRECTYLVPEDTADLRATLTVLTDLGGLAVCLPVTDVSGLQAPVARSVEEDVTTLLARVADLTARAKTCTTADDDGNKHQIRAGTADTVRRELDEARARLALWQDRLGLQLTTVRSSMAEAEKAMDVAVDDALQAIEARRAARDAARAAQRVGGELLNARRRQEAAAQERFAGIEEIVVR
jgi:hypothetical protein